MINLIGKRVLSEDIKIIKEKKKKDRENMNQKILGFIEK